MFHELSSPWCGLVEVSCVKISLGAVCCVLLRRGVEGDAVAKSDGKKFLDLVLMLWARLLQTQTVSSCDSGFGALVRVCE